MSSDQAAEISSASNEPPRTRILPHESQLGGTTILSRSITLCLRGWRLRREVIPKVEWTKEGSWEGEF